MRGWKPIYHCYAGYGFYKRYSDESN
ncbi:hypothetical protein BVI434_410152 [Burkholderia vietnamiensis]|nr:hypothetical protein BVI434_410152 [Burkholderia vietnamiensis]